MRAAVYERYGPPEVVRITEVPTPEAGAGEVLVRVDAATVGVSDSAGRAGQPAFARLFFGLRRPKRPILGSEFAGVIEAVGDGVSRFRPGDVVFGATGVDGSTNAELVRIGQDAALAIAPDGLDPVDAVALVDGFLTALPFLRDVARLRPGQTVLVNGASGTVGSAAVQLAKHFGASVTAVCSERNRDLVLSLGADRVIDYGREDFTRARNAYDVIFDAVSTSSFARCRRALTQRGIYLATVPSLAIMLQTPLTKAFGRRRAAITFTGLRDARAKADDLQLLLELVESGSIVPVIDRVVPFEQIVEAHRRVDTGHKVGTVVVAIPGTMTGATSRPASVEEEAA